MELKGTLTQNGLNSGNLDLSPGLCGKLLV